MQHTEQQIESIVKNLLNDLEQEYRKEEKIVILFETQTKIPGTSTLIDACWVVGVPVDDEQFGHKDGSSIIIFIEDDTGNIIGYLDCSGGRPNLLRAQKNEEGKYFLERVAD